MVPQYSWLYITGEVGWEDPMGISGLSWELTGTSFPDRKFFGAKFFLSFIHLLCFATFWSHFILISTLGGKRISILLFFPTIVFLTCPLDIGGLCDTGLEGKCPEAIVKQ